MFAQVTWVKLSLTILFTLIEMQTVCTHDFMCRKRGLSMGSCLFHAVSWPVRKIWFDFLACDIDYKNVLLTPSVHKSILLQYVCKAIPRPGRLTNDKRYATESCNGFHRPFDLPLSEQTRRNWIKGVNHSEVDGTSLPGSCKHKKIN